MSRAYYNEIDPYAAQWLRNLIAAGLIAPGDVDERSIVDVCPADLSGYTQCHFFAGIGVWSAALRGADWRDDRPVWTGSCPCQPFSASGKGHGFADERHLWPAWYHLIGECRPTVVFGEQVASPNGYTWLDLVQADLEAAAYTCWPVVLPAAGFGAPHGRHRIFYVAHPSGRGQRELGRQAQPGRERHADIGSASVGLADANSERGCGRAPWGADAADAWLSGKTGELADADGGNTRAERLQRSGEQRQQPADRSPRRNSLDTPVNGFWFDAGWIYCTDEKWRPVEAGTFPLVDGAEFEVGSGSTLEGKSRTKMLRGYGNAIVREAAEEFIRAADEVML